MYLGLKGSMEGRTLHFNLLSGVGKSVEESKYDFAFKAEEQSEWPWARFSDLIYTKKITEEISADFVKKCGVKVGDEERHTINRNIGRAKREFEVAEAIVYQEIDGTDDDNNYSFEDVVEIFIRANSGGTKLSKSDLMFTLLTTQWEVADTEMDEFLQELNDNRFEFNRDFVIKTAMSLLDYGAKYDVDKLYKESVRKNIADNWKNITQAISFVRDQMISKTFIRSNKALTSYNALIPLIYFRYHFPAEWGLGKFLKSYLLRVLLSAAFSGQPDGLIDKLVALIRTTGRFDTKKIFALFEASGRSLNLSEGMWNWGYTSGQIHVLFNYWYDTSYKPSFSGFLPQIDHIFARSRLSAERIKSEQSGRMVQRYSAWEINQLGNCMLLTALENGAGDKSDQELDVWLKDKDEKFLELHCIPKRKALWKIDRYEEFIEARQALIAEKFAEIMQSDDE